MWLVSHSLTLSPWDADAQGVLWGEDEDNTGQSQRWVTGLPYFLPGGHWPHGIDFQEVRKKREREVSICEARAYLFLIILHLMSSTRHEAKVSVQATGAFRGTATSPRWPKGHVTRQNQGQGTSASLSLSEPVPPPVPVARPPFVPLRPGQPLSALIWLYLSIRIHAASREQPPNTRPKDPFGFQAFLSPRRPFHVTSEMTFTGPRVSLVPHSPSAPAIVSLHH